MKYDALTNIQSYSYKTKLLYDNSYSLMTHDDSIYVPMDFIHRLAILKNLYIINNDVPTVFVDVDSLKFADAATPGSKIFCQVRTERFSSIDEWRKKYHRDNDVVFVNSIRKIKDSSVWIKFANLTREQIRPYKKKLISLANFNSIMDPYTDIESIREYVNSKLIMDDIKYITCPFKSTKKPKKTKTVFKYKQSATVGLPVSYEITIPPTT